MNKIQIKVNHNTSDIILGESFHNLEKYIPNSSKTIFITDNNVFDIYHWYFKKKDVIIIGTGEKIKNLNTIQSIYDKLMEFGADRSSFIVGFGGGIVCDIAGFAASTYMRGIPFGFVATTLLAQVDASVGGKNGVNYHDYKNMIGTYNQPEFVICDQQVLHSLSNDELRCGFAEIVKHACISSIDMFELLENNTIEALSLNKDVIRYLVEESVKIKSNIVNQDEREKGERRRLNFGHTLGHAIEKEHGIKHGEAVSIGIVFATNLSFKKGNISIQDVDRIKALLINLGLPIEYKIDKAAVIGALFQDKKRESAVINFILLNAIGSAAVELISINELKQAIYDLC